MAKKSELRGERRISATEASRSFSKLLDSVEKGRRFVVYRHGRDVCLITPPTQMPRRASESVARLRGASPTTLDDCFGEDLLRILAEEAPEERPAWGS